MRKVDLKTLPLLAQKVYVELSKIPKGAVISYAELAKRVGKPKAVRAVATLVGKNPILVKIPCHRIIRSNGEIGQYTTEGGRNSNTKLKLLQSEGVEFEKKVLKRGVVYTLKSARKGAIL